MSLSKGCWQVVPQRDTLRKKLNFMTSVDVEYRRKRVLCGELDLALVGVKPCFSRKIIVFATVCVLTGCLMLSYLLGKTPASSNKKVYDPAHVEHHDNTLIWAVNVDTNLHSKDKIDKIANDLDLINLGQVGELHGHYLFAHKVHGNFSGKKTMSSVHAVHSQNFSKEELSDQIKKIEKKLDSHDGIQWYSHQKLLSRGRRFLAYNIPYMNFSDPYYKSQWHLGNARELGMDVNVTDVWRQNITGAGITVAVVDDGLEWNNPDLLENFNQAGSWNLNNDDSDPMPDPHKDKNHHGTRCAGEIAAVPNNICGVGVAYGSKVSGVRLLDGPLTDSLEAEAFTKFFQVNHIYSCSWGPDDDGKTVDGPHILAAAGMKHGIDFGRGGYGSIYVVASGNGGQAGDNCNYDGYANSLYTVTIGAVDETGRMPYYSEECASMLAVTFSSGYGGTSRDIVTTDWTFHTETIKGCTQHHTGTSAAAPIAAALIALMFEAQPCLTWRDVQYIIALTAVKIDIDVAQWQRNGAGLWHSHKHGFGLMNAWRLVNAAKVWDQVPWQTSFSYGQKHVDIPVTKGSANPLKLSYSVTERDANSFDLYIMETAQVTLTLDHPYRGHLQFQLVSPSGTVSVIGASRPHDNSTDGFDGWTFSTVRCWGESPVGTWTFIISDTDSSSRYKEGILHSWSLKLFGTPMTPQQLKERRKAVQEALHGGFLNRTGRCSPPPVTSTPDETMSIRTLKIILMMGSFCFLFAVYEILEYICCYGEEKKEHAKLTKLIKRAHVLARQHLYGATQNQNNTEEIVGLLGNNIPMETLQPSNDLDCDRSEIDCRNVSEENGNMNIISNDHNSGSDSVDEPQTLSTEKSLKDIERCDKDVNRINNQYIPKTGSKRLHNNEGNPNTSVINDNVPLHSLVKENNIGAPRHLTQSCKTKVDRNNASGLNAECDVGNNVIPLRLKDKGKRQKNKDGYTLLQNCSDESETEL